MKNLTIAKKLGVLVSIALVGLVIVSLGSAYELRASQRRFSEVQENIIPSIILLNEASSDSAALRAAVRDYIIGMFLGNPTMAKQQADLVKGLEKKIVSKLDVYEKELVSNEKDRDLLKEHRKALQAYLVEVDDVFSKANQKDAAGLSEQLSENGRFRKTAGLLLKSFSEHASFNQSLVEESKSAGDKEFRMGMIFLAAVGVFVFATLGILGTIIIFGIRSPLQHMQSLMETIENSLDLRVRANSQSKDEIGHTSRALDSVLEKLQSGLGAIAENTKVVGASASQMATTSAQVAKASHRQSEAASNMAATVQEMTVSINHVGDRARDADGIAIESGKLAKQGEDVIVQTVGEIDDISVTVDSASNKIKLLVESSQKISSVVAAIKEIADQTNLLALNAAIEAARAGEQGRGFAVVADEVRKLAERTSSSTQEIADTIESMCNGATDVATSMNQVEKEVREGVESIQQARVVIRNIEEGSQKTVEVVEEISSAIREQASAMTSIAQQVEQIAHMSEESSAAAKNSAEIASDLDRLAIDMTKIVGAYRL